MKEINPTGTLYYVEYSRNMASGNRLNLRAVMTEAELAWYLQNFSEKYHYLIHSARIATSEEIKEFEPKSYDEN